MELALLMWALGDLPAAMAGEGAVALGPAPWITLPPDRLQLFWTPGLAVPRARLRLLDGPWFLWLDMPPPRVGFGRVPAYALVALVNGPEGLDLAWEITAAPWLSAYGSLGSEPFAGFKLRSDPLWGALQVKGGRLSLWLGASLSF